jgi:transcription termination/antitermination protein NusG
MVNQGGNTVMARAKSNRYDDRRAWYAIHTYSGYEEQVASQIEQRIKGVDMANKIYNVLVPKEKMIVIKNGKRKVVEQKIFQGYVLVEMRLSDDTWFIIRNTPGVTGFVGTGTHPTPVSEKEIKEIRRRMGVNEPKHDIDLQIDEIVNIVDGPFKGFEGSVSEIDPVKGKIKVLVSMFGRDTSVELDVLQVKKI